MPLLPLLLCVLPSGLLLGALLPGCAELVHMGQLSDQEGAYPVGNARIEQQGPDGDWKLLGKTDGNGRWWIVKKDIEGGGCIRVTKSGYHPLHMPESEFLQQFNLMMVPTGGRSLGEDALRMKDEDALPPGRQEPRE